MNSSRVIVGLGIVAVIGGFIAALPTRGQPLPQGLTKSFNMEYYDVTGRNWPEVLADIFQSRPLVPGTNERFEGVTSYNITVGPRAMVQSGQCSPALATVDLAITMKVPRLADNVHLGGDDQDCWALYDRSLTDHEEGHLQLALGDGRTLLNLLRSTRNASCGDLLAIAAREERQMRENQRAYDVVTEHGKTQWRRYGLDESVDTPEDQQLKRRCFR